LAQIAASSGGGQTVAIVDAYDDPTAESDLGTYRSWFGLPPCSSGNGCFSKVNQTGGTSYPAQNASWAQEIALDLDMVSAICPNCHILLVEGNSNSYADLGVAENWAASHSVNAISNSYGGGEWSGETGYDAPYNHPGVAVTASSGDGGYGVEFPAASPYVTAVGGTTLNQATNTGTRDATETVWSGAGSGCSAYESKPSWQTDAGCSRRTVADVAAEADPNTAVWVYYNGGWYMFGGTSVASPIIASVYALAGNPPSATSLNSDPYSHPTALFDITSGNNSSTGCSPAYLCTGEPAYDGPTGLGTPNGAAAFSNAPGTPDFALAASPTSVSLASGGSAGFAVSVTASNGFANTVTLTTSAPAGVTVTPNTTTVSASNGVYPSTSFTVSSSTVGTSTVTITGTSASLSHTTSVSVVVGDFGLACAPSSLSVAQNGSGQSTCTVTSTGGFNSPVNLSCASPPTGISCSYNPSTVTPPAGGTAMSSLTLTVAPSVTPGSYSVQAQGTSGGLTHSTTLQVTVSTATTPNFTISCSPASLTQQRNSSGTSTCTVTSTGSFSSAVSLSCASVPAGVSCAFSPNSVTPAANGSVTSTLTIRVRQFASRGTFTIQVRGQSGNLTNTAAIQLIVQ
jgi:subtilase family serine protease